MAPADAVNAANCATVLEYKVKGAVLRTSDAGLNVIVVGDEIVYVPVVELGALILEVTSVPTVMVPDTFNESLTCIADESEELISLISIVFGIAVR